MKNLVIAFGLMIFVLVGCNDDDDENTPPETIIVDSSMPSGAFTANLLGDFVEQNGTGSSGTAQIGVDAEGTQFLRFSDDFTSNFATGTITVYLSTSDEVVFDPGNGNPALRIVAPVTSGGEKFFRLDPPAASQFGYVILWCGSAGIPFGYADLN
jgi:hypothetical protein